MKYRYYILTFVLLVLLNISFTLAIAFSTDQFNNSLTTENLRFQSTAPNPPFIPNFTRFLAVPENISALSTVLMNITIRNPDGGNVFLPYNFSMGGSALDSCVDSTPETILAVDGDFSSCGFTSIGSGVFVNQLMVTQEMYFINQSQSSIVYTVKYEAKTCDLNPGACKVQYKLLAFNFGTGVFDSVFNGPIIFNSSLDTFLHNITISNSFYPNGVAVFQTRADLFRLGGSGTTDFNFFEGGILNQIGTASPNNTFIDVGGDGTKEVDLGSFLGNFFTINLASAVTAFLNANCTIVNGTCFVPFLFGSSDAGIINYQEMLFTNAGFIENELIFDNNTVETATQNLSINLTLDIDQFDFISAKLIYNGTTVSATSLDMGNTRIFTSSNFDNPLVGSGDSELKEFHWEVTLTDILGNVSVFNSTFQTQNVTKIKFEQCGALTTEFINFTAFDEGNLTSIDPFEFSGTFDIWLGTGSIRRITPVEDLSVSEMKICMTPSDKTFNIDAVISYDSVDEGLYVERDFHIQNDQITNASQNIPLFLLLSADSTTFIIKVRDNTLLPVPNALVAIERFFPGLNEFRTVQVALTDDNGKTVGFYKTETVDYRHTITINDEVALQTTQQKIVGEDTPFTLIFTIGEGAGDPLAEFEDIEDLVATLLFNDSTNVVTYNYDDTSGNFTSARLLVQQVRFDRDFITICDVNSSTAVGILSCNLTAFDGTFVAQAFNSRSPETLSIAISFIISTIRDIFGENGLFLAFFIILSTALTAIWNPTVGIIAVNASVIFVNIIGLATFSPIWIFSMIGISITLIILLKT